MNRWTFRLVSALALAAACVALPACSGNKETPENKPAAPEVKPSASEKPSAQDKKVAKGGGMGGARTKQEFSGKLLSVSEHGKVRGWAWNKAEPTAPVRVDLFLDDTQVGTIPADAEWDKETSPPFVRKGGKKHVFEFIIPDHYHDGKEHVIKAKFAGMDDELEGSPFKPVVLQEKAKKPPEKNGEKKMDDKKGNTKDNAAKDTPKPPSKDQDKAKDQDKGKDQAAPASKDKPKDKDKPNT